MISFSVQHNIITSTNVSHKILFKTNQTIPLYQSKPYSPYTIYKRFKIILKENDSLIFTQ